ncbi:bifunctional adenosylcobinamide kinase/adenosylcobinamide-phosphate guanylyltransferase [Neobacillus pocheonensis]|uniref:bifunctional adenosylcobinamide kinase/adenosylcobinamide-phosphate guanylyltransferase n=1 Tax=Neobacillus pocheonensis TaxID=363869 RepID=UPI003D2655E1
MHFVTGGAFNGKRAWVMEAYKVSNEDGLWLSAYHNCRLPRDLGDIDQNVVILEGAETWLKKLVGNFDLNQCRIIWNQCLDSWLKWEKEKLTRKVVIIGTDITKGIVPIETHDRAWRDVTGWAFQDTASRAEEVDIIWYGINQQIK